MAVVGVTVTEPVVPVSRIAPGGSFPVEAIFAVDSDTSPYTMNFEDLTHHVSWASLDDVLPGVPYQQWWSAPPSAQDVLLRVYVADAVSALVYSAPFTVGVRTARTMDGPWVIYKDDGAVRLFLAPFGWTVSQSEAVKMGTAELAFANASVVGGQISKASLAFSMSR